MSCQSSWAIVVDPIGQVGEVAGADEVAQPLGVEHVGVEGVGAGRRVEQRLVVDRLEADRDDVDVAAGEALPVRGAPLERLRDLRAVERQDVDVGARELAVRGAGGGLRTAPQPTRAAPTPRRCWGRPSAPPWGRCVGAGVGVCAVQAASTSVMPIAGAIDLNLDTQLLLLTAARSVQHTERPAVG